MLDEKFIEREEIFDGAVLNVVKDTVLLPNGKCATREFCLHVGAVAVIPLLDDGRVIMERQYRYAHGKVLLEIPAGKLNSKSEDPLEAVKRELREETGASAKSYEFIGELIPTPAIVNEKIYMYLAENISFGERELDEDEFLDVEFISAKALYEMVMMGEIQDAKTQVAILKLKELRKEIFV